MSADSASSDKYTMTPKWMVYSLMALTTTVAFNNCSGGFTAIDTTDLSTASSQCREKIKNKVTDVAMDPALCESPLNYQCDVRHFRKGVGNEAGQAVHCTDIAGLGETCVAVNIFNYDTTAQQKTATAAELVEGGSYNRDEVSCINTQIISRNIAMIQSEGDSFASTLEKTIENCRQRSRQ